MQVRKTSVRQLEELPRSLQARGGLRNEHTSCDIGVHPFELVEGQRTVGGILAKLLQLGRHRLIHTFLEVNDAFPLREGEARVGKYGRMLVELMQCGCIDGIPVANVVDVKESSACLLRIAVQPYSLKSDHEGLDDNLGARFFAVCVGRILNEEVEHALEDPLRARLLRRRCISEQMRYRCRDKTDLVNRVVVTLLRLLSSDDEGFVQVRKTSVRQLEELTRILQTCHLGGVALRSSHIDLLARRCRCYLFTRKTSSIKKHNIRPVVLALVAGRGMRFETPTLPLSVFPTVYVVA